MKKVLVIHSWGVGDLLMATPMLKSLYLSGYVVDIVLFSKQNITILKEANFINKTFLIESKLQLFKFYKKYDYLISTAGTNPNKIKLLNFLIRAKKVFATSQQRDIHRIELNLKNVAPLLTKIDKNPYIFLKNDKTVLKKYIKDGMKVVGFAVGSGHKQKFKRWRSYEKLISKIDANKLVFIGKDELEIEESFKKLDVTIVKESLEDVIAIIANTDLMVGNDNGLMHIAYATGVNTVTIHGMTSQKQTGGYRKNNNSISLDMECRPCFDPSTDRVGCNSYECLKDIEVSEVLKVCQRYL